MDERRRIDVRVDSDADDGLASVMFAAEPPSFFAPSIGTTSKEERHWTRFREDQGLVNAEIAYVCQKSLKDDDSLMRRIRDAAENSRCRVWAVVVGTVDAMLQRIVTGGAGLDARLRHLAKRKGLAALNDAVLSLDFEIALTADQGNVECLGVGTPNVGITTDERGKRVHVFRDDTVFGRQGTSLGLWLGARPAESTTTCR